jgi:hypothetical protein
MREGRMRQVRYLGPDPSYTATAFGITFESGGPAVEVPDELAEMLMQLNPRGLPVEHAGEYAQQVFEVVGGEAPEAAPEPEGGES